MSIDTIVTPEQAQEIFELTWEGRGASAGDFTYVTSIEGEPRRWSQTVTIVVSDRNGCFWGLRYERGLTEEQPISYPWVAGYDRLIPVRLTRLYPHVVTETVYRTTPPSTDAEVSA